MRGPASGGSDSPSTASSARRARLRAPASLRAPIAGAAFLAAFVAAQWPFASFLMTEHARNWFFGAHYMDYGTPPSSAYAQFLFAARGDSPLSRGLLIAAIISIVMMWLGMHAGRAMQRVRR